MTDGFCYQINMIFKRHKIIKNFGENCKKPIKLTICDLNPSVLDAFSASFVEVQEVSVVQGDITKFKCDAIITAGNSYGDMGGGVDKAIDDWFSGEAQKTVRNQITKNFFGELPVGTAITVYPNKNRPPLIYAPTMRIPGLIQNTINPYLAMRASLITAINNGFEHVACSAFGCGVGGLHPVDAADQMKTAFIVIVYEKWKEIIHPAQAPYAMR